MACDDGIGVCGSRHGDRCQRGRRRHGLHHRAVGPLHPLAALGDAERPLRPRAAHHHRADGGAAIGGRLRVHGAALEPGDAAALGGGGAGHRRADRRLQGLSAGRRRAQIRRIAQDRLGLVVDFLPVHGHAAARPEAVLLAARPGAVGRDAQADRAAVLDRHRRPLRAGRNPHPARRRRDARVRAAQRRLCLEFGDLPVLDGRHLAGPADRRHPVPAQPDQADPAAGRRRRKFRQGPRGAEFPPARRARGAARGAGLHRDENAHRARDRAAHRHAGRRVARPAHRAHALQARARADRRQPRGRGDEEGRRRDGAHAGGLSRLRARRSRRAVGADRHGGLPRGAAARCRAPRPSRHRRLPRPPDRHGAAGGVQALPRQSRVQRRALCVHDRDHRPSRPPLADGDGRRRRAGHPAARCARKCSSRSCGSTTRATEADVAKLLHHDGALGLFRQRRLSPRTDLQCRRRLRKAALRGHRRAGAARRRRQAAHHARHRCRSTSPDRRGQRHRHEPRRDGRGARHHRALGHQGLPGADRGQQGRRKRDPDRPVRRRLLFGLHGGGPRRRGLAPRRHRRGVAAGRRTARAPFRYRRPRSPTRRRAAPASSCI